VKVSGSTGCLFTYTATPPGFAEYNGLPQAGYSAVVQPHALGDAILYRGSNQRRMRCAFDASALSSEITETLDAQTSEGEDY